MTIPMPVLGRVGVVMETVGIQLQIPSTVALAHRAGLGVAVGRLHDRPIHERIRMRVVHVRLVLVGHSDSSRSQLASSHAPSA